jgi:hypothetical protein
VPQPVFAALHHDPVELLFGFGCGRRFQRHPFDRLAPGVILDGDPGHELPVASPQSANCVLAVVQDFGVIYTDVSLNLNQFDCPALLCVSYGNVLANTVANIKLTAKKSCKSL